MSLLNLAFQPVREKGQNIGCYTLGFIFYFLSSFNHLRGGVCGEMDGNLVSYFLLSMFLSSHVYLSLLLFFFVSFFFSGKLLKLGIKQT